MCMIPSKSKKHVLSNVLAVTLLVFTKKMNWIPVLFFNDMYSTACNVMAIIDTTGAGIVLNTRHLRYNFKSQQNEMNRIPLIVVRDMHSTTCNVRKIISLKRTGTVFINKELTHLTLEIERVMLVGGLCIPKQLKYKFKTEKTGPNSHKRPNID